MSSYDMKVNENMDMDIYTNIIKKILGKDLYNKLLEYFLWVLKYTCLKEPVIKIFMARKSYCLFKIFMPILRSELDESENVDELFSYILNDRAVLFSVEKIKNHRHFLIVDDTMKYGRSVAKTIELLKDVFHIRVEQIEISVFAVLSKYLLLKNDENFAYFAKAFDSEKGELEERFRFCYNQKAPADCPYFLGDLSYYDETAINQFCSNFIKAIHAVGETYSGYSPYFTIFGNDLNAFFNRYPAGYEKSVKFLRKEFADYDIDHILTHDHDKNGVAMFLFAPKSSNDANGKLVNNIRLIVHQKLKKVTIVPLVIFPDLKIGPAFNKFIELTHIAFPLGMDVLQHDKYGGEYAIVKYNLMLYAFAHLAAYDFINKFKDKFSIDHRKMIFNNDFICVNENDMKDFVDGYFEKPIDLAPVFQYEATWKKKSSAHNEYGNDSYIEDVFNKSFLNVDFADVESNSFDIKKLLDKYYAELVCADKPGYKKSNRLPISYLYERIKEVFDAKKINMPNKREWNYALTRLFETGSAGSRIDAEYVDGELCVFVFAPEGEAGSTAFYVPLDGFHKALENIFLYMPMSEKNEVNDKHIENIKACFANYIEQQFSSNKKTKEEIRHRFNVLFSSDLYNRNKLKSFDRLYTIDKGKSMRMHRNFFKSFSKLYIEIKPASLQEFKDKLTPRQTEADVSNIYDYI